MKYCFSLLIFFFLFINVNAQKRVAIIGAGMSGVSAAHHILELDSKAKITLFEKEKKAGGNARTIKITNRGGKEVFVDAGPQYFAEGPWDGYINFLKAYNLYDENEMSTFVASFVITNDVEQRPEFVTPKNGSFRGEKFANLLKFNKFYSAALKVFKKKGNYPANIGDWVEGLKIKGNFKQNVVFPFLASSLGTTVAEIKNTSTEEIVSLFAFQSAMKKSEFKISDKGMGTLIHEVSLQLKEKNVKVLFDAPVTSLKKLNNVFELTYGNGTTAEFDFVVFATHPYQAAKILESEKFFNDFSQTLNQFEYFLANIVLHRDSSFVNQEKASFLNIFTSHGTNDVNSNTMNLGLINPGLKGIYKSWLKAEDTKKVRDNKTFIHQEVFYHPMITPEFKAHLIDLKKLSQTVSSIYFAGGWSEGLETQETAINSGKNAAKAYLNFKNK